ncbi:uncharacterized protein LOC135955635 [Calliphora vicina]|uniref:uncharacterized protein LOC135955635 n=1 Tax=Calliphora vicina TaxID=7373 RepID=UPI00325A49E8
MAKVLELVALLAICISCVWSLDICEDQVDGAQILYPTDCSKYVVCRLGQTYAIEQCTEGRHFNRLTSQCDEPTEAACDVEVIKNLLVNSEECNVCRTACGCLSESTSPTPASSTPASPTPASPTPDSPTPASPTPASPTPDSPTPASPTPESSTPASPTPASPTPASPTPESSTPASPTPDSPTPASPTPESSTPASPTPDSPTPASPTPASPSPESSTPASPTPESPTPASPTPASPSPESSTPASPTPDSPTPASPTPASPTPESPTPASPTPASPTPESSTPASPTPASPTPESPTPASPTPESSTPGSPTPASPTPASPTPESPTPASPTPASPTPASPTPDLPTPAPTNSPSCLNDLQICVGQPDYSSVYLPESCSQYAICISECANVLSCPNNLLYDLASHSCTYPENANCPYPHTAPSGPSAGPSGTKCEQHGKCENQPDGSLFADDTSNGYIVCQCECEIARPCPANLVFNDSLKVCDYPLANY